MEKGTYFISGIDTNIGKSVITGHIAKQLYKQGMRITTQKMIQTGNEGYSEDILLHRRIMNINLTEEDESFLTAPCIRSYPCSPHLAAKIDNSPIDMDQITAATHKLEEKYDIILIEGAGGLMVPIKEDVLTIDYICKQNYPLIFITSGKLGSLNHTLLSLEAIKSRGIRLYKLIYNLFPESDPIIEKDTLEYLKLYISSHFPETELEIVGKIEC